MAKKQRLVVIGNGMAGARLLEELVARNASEAFDIVVFGDEPYGNYNRILLSSVLAGTHDTKDIFINPLAWYKDNGITLHAGVKAGWVDRLAKKVYAPGGISESYDKLVIATGSLPFVPPVDGIANDTGGSKEGVFVFRTLDDTQAIISWSAQARTAAVIGGGLLGLEAARGLLNRGLEVHVVHLMPSLMEIQLDTQSGEMLRGVVEKMGMRIHLQKVTRGILGDGRVSGLAFQDGSSLNCDMVVFAAGIRPNVELAKQAGLFFRRGIMVNDDLCSRSDPDIYAVGECVEHRGKTYGIVAPLWEQTRVLADRLTEHNQKATYVGSRVYTKLKVAGVDLTVMGDKDSSGDTDEVVTYSEPTRGVYKKLVVRDGHLMGAILLGDGMTGLSASQAFDRQAKLPDNRAELLFPLASQTQALNVADMQDSDQVCNCNGVSKGKLVAAVKAGSRSFKSLCDATRAGTGCGSCKPLVQAILELASDGLVTQDPSMHYYVPGIPLTKSELMNAIKERNLRSVSEVFQALAEGKEDPGSKMGLASLLKTIWGKEYEDERDARFINDRVHANIQRDGTFSVVPRIYGGVTSPKELRRIADVAERFDVPMVKITGGQRIDLLGVAKEQLPQIWKELEIPSGHAYTKAFRTCKTCVGTDFCRYGLGDSVALGIKIEKRFQGIEAPHKMKLASSGCPRNCAEATVKDLGAVAIEGGKWEVYIGGAAGAKVRKADILCVVETHDEVMKYMGRFMQYYRENAKYQERTYDFVERMGIEQLRRLLVQDAEGICQRLDKDIQSAVDAYSDPWREAESPVHNAQFKTVLASVES
ncbi:MAG: NAD(P)/FAD-dependent oxidoreductase [Chloroflexi bacterium]|nr:NAD(P)/FAD-dependent oxidoreductase [Chloroflexota bacterium]